MEFIFLNAAGTTLFTRTDIESGHWVQHEYSVNADFPFVPGKVIERGMRIAFRDPATDNIEVFEIRNVVNTEPDHFQQITAEHIALAELSDEHIDTTEITDKTAAQALSTALTGTLWSVGNNTASGTQSTDFSRGSVWNAVNAIQNNWNVYITPRVVISSAGAITGRYLDIAPAGGTFRGVRLSIRKNLLDPVVTYDDSEVLTALYGYGGNVDVTVAGQDDKQEELTFKDVVWSATSSHPAKPANQTYLEWPEKTALYGRNGRARFGYYQNSDIKDAGVLLQKTWEALQRTCDPKISIAGTCVDLYRLGYKDQPLRLHDTAIVEIEETGETFSKEIIMLDVDLVDPSGNRPEIGDYIPNIVYINRDTEDKATGGSGGGGGGGGGGRGMTKLQDELSDTITEFIKTNEQIGMVVKRRNGEDYILAGQIVLAINKSGETGEYESTAWINADHINIGASQTVYTLAGSLYHDETGKLVVKDGVGLYAEHTVGGSTAKFGVFDDNTLTGGICATKINSQSGSQTITRIIGDLIVVGNSSSIDADYRGKTLDGTLTAITSDFVSVNTLLAKKIEADDINATTVQAAISRMTVLQCQAFGCSGGASVSGILAASGGINAPFMNLDGVSVGAAVYNVRITGPDSNNNYTLQKQTIAGSGWTNVGTFERGDTGAAYNQGWNDCIDAASGGYYLSGYSNWNSGSSSTLYYYDTGSLSYKVATGSAKVWRYGGGSYYRYTLPDPK